MFEGHRTHEQLERIEHKLDQLAEEVKNMAVTQAQFDVDLAALVAAINGLETAVAAWVAANPAADFTAEDTEVQSAAAAVAAALADVTPAPPPGP